MVYVKSRHDQIRFYYYTDENKSVDNLITSRVTVHKGFRKEAFFLFICISPGSAAHFIRNNFNLFTVCINIYINIY